MKNEEMTQADVKIDQRLNTLILKVSGKI